MRNFCTAIIPFYNEGSRVDSVLQVITKIQDITEIICVDDGSTDNAYKEIKSKYPKVKLIKLRTNHGKAKAVLKSLKYAKGKYIFLSDGDLKGLRKSEIQKAINKIKKHTWIDMIILRRRNDTLNSRLLRGDILVSGERILTKEDLKKSLLIKSVDGYQLEIAINRYMMKNHKRVYWVISSAHNAYKIKKFGLIKGLQKDLEMELSFVQYAGLLSYSKQILIFCRKELD